MIIVSTTSPAEAILADRAMKQGLPLDVGYSVYLNGTLHGERPGRPVHPAEDIMWPPPVPEVRG